MYGSKSFVKLQKTYKERFILLETVLETSPVMLQTLSSNGSYFIVSPNIQGGGSKKRLNIRVIHNKVIWTEQSETFHNYIARVVLPHLLHQEFLNAKYISRVIYYGKVAQTKNVCSKRILAFLLEKLVVGQMTQSNNNFSCCNVLSVTLNPIHLSYTEVLFIWSLYL